MYIYKCIYIPDPTPMEPTVLDWYWAWNPLNDWPTKLFEKKTTYRDFPVEVSGGGVISWFVKAFVLINKSSINIYLYTNIQLFIYLYVCIYIRKIYMYTYTYMYICMYVYIYVYVYMHT
jgi:hypothetical protein